MVRLLNSTDELEVLQMRNLRNEVLRLPLGLNLFDEDLAAEQDQIVAVYLSEDHVQGVVMAKLLGDGIAKLRQMAVAAAYQKQGIGKQLVQFLEKHLCSIDINRIELHARVPVRSFYESQAYTASGKEFLEVGIPHIAMYKVLLPKVT
ncbi:MAG: putative N-acetyltransferase YjcF [Bacteroidota bacterium]|jgi:predicted GNAT family N-acyltransferase